MNPQSKGFLIELRSLFQKHSASVAFDGNRLKWYVGNEQLPEGGICSNRKTINDLLNDFKP